MTLLILSKHRLNYSNTAENGGFLVFCVSLISMKDNIFAPCCWAMKYLLFFSKYILTILCWILNVAVLFLPQNATPTVIGRRSSFSQSQLAFPFAAKKRQHLKFKPCWCYVHFKKTKTLRGTRHSFILISCLLFSIIIIT